MTVSNGSDRTDGTGNIRRHAATRFPYFKCKSGRELHEKCCQTSSKVLSRLLKTFSELHRWLRRDFGCKTWIRTFLLNIQWHSKLFQSGITIEHQKVTLELTGWEWKNCNSFCAMSKSAFQLVIFQDFPLSWAEFLADKMCSSDFRYENIFCYFFENVLILFV